MAAELEALPSQREGTQADQRLAAELTGLEREAQLKSAELTGVLPQRSCVPMTVVLTQPCKPVL